MNLFSLHSDPEQLVHYDERLSIVPLTYATIRDEARRTGYQVTSNRLIQSLLPYIMKSAQYASLYSFNILEARWPEAEPYIMKDPRSAFNYARYVLGERWREAEQYIKQDESFWSAYMNFFSNEFKYD